MNEKDWQNLKEDKISVRLNNADDYREFARKCEAHGLSWTSAKIMVKFPNNSDEYFGEFPMLLVMTEEGLCKYNMIDFFALYPTKQVIEYISNIKRVAKIVGVELNEEFRVWELGRDRVFHLSLKGLYESNLLSLSDILIKLITREYTVEKLRYRPKQGEIYWWNPIVGTPNFSYWDSSTQDYGQYYLGNRYRTQAEALTNRVVFAEKLKNKYNNY